MAKLHNYTSDETQQTTQSWLIRYREYSVFAAGKKIKIKTIMIRVRSDRRL